jgi:hypothetical protein
MGKLHFSWFLVVYLVIAFAYLMDACGLAHHRLIAGLLALLYLVVVMLIAANLSH